MRNPFIYIFFLPELDREKCEQMGPWQHLLQNSGYLFSNKDTEYL